MASPRLALIAAVARNGVIGRGNALPWHIPADLRHLREQTLGHPVIMGRATWDSLPPRFRPLPGRTNIVVTRQRGWAQAGARVAHDLPQALGLAADAMKVFVIGGAQLYAEALPRADELVLTEIDADVDGDVRFPAWDRDAFLEVERTHHAADAPGGYAFDFVTYRRRH